MQGKRLFMNLGGAALVIGVIVGFKFYNRGQADAQTRQEAAEIIQNLPGYQADPAYYDTLFNQAHPAAFEAAYTMGGRRRSARFDDARYLSTLLSEMVQQARSDGRHDVAAALTGTSAGR